MSPTASVVIVAFNNGDELIDCVESILRNADRAEILVVVNGDARNVTPKLAGRQGVVLVDTGENRGFAGGCNVGASRAAGEVLVFLNPDTLVAPGALQALVLAALEPGVGLVMPRLRLRDDPELLNSGGGAIHVCGQGWASSYRQPAASLTARQAVAAASGAAMAVRRDTFLTLGGFLEEMFAYHEDAELSWRAHMRGLEVIVIPDADVFHAYEFSRHPIKFELLERNRLLFVMTCYGSRLLGLLAPVLFIYELAIVAVAARQGWLGAKWRGWSWCWSHRSWLACRRTQIQADRVISDRSLAGLLTPVLDPSQVDLPRGVALFNLGVSRYWGLVRRLL